MISNVSSTPATTSIPPNPAVKLVPSSSNRGATSNGDTVQLSAATQQILASTKSSTSTQKETISEIIKEAAGGDISALAQLALIG